MTPYIGEIRIFAGNFAPVGWASCNGQLAAIADFEDLFNLIGTTYGGDGQQTFALPNLTDRFPMHRAPGHPLGEAGSGPLAVSPPVVPLQYIIAVTGQFLRPER